MGFEGGPGAVREWDYGIGELGADMGDDENPLDKKSERKSEFCGAFNSYSSRAERRRNKRIMLQLTKPSYTLLLGMKGVVRHETRARLRFLLDLLVRQRNWREASGVLSVLLKGTCRERLVSNNRIKYSVAMELHGNMNINDIYDLWMKKIVSLKSRPLKDKSALLEFSISCLADKNLKEAPRHAICLMQDHVAQNDPISNLMLGLCHDELLYDTLPNEMKLGELDEPIVSYKLDGSGIELRLVENCDAHGSVDTPKTCFSARPSKTSVRNDKKITTDNLSERENMAETTLHGKETGNRFLGQNLHAISDDTSMDRRLLSDTTDNSEDARNGLQLNQSHRDALKYLENALNSTPPALEALLPLVQLYLAGKQVKRAFDVVERSCENSDSVVPLRLMSRLLESHDSNNFAELSVYYEKLLRRDPACSRSIRSLVYLNETGHYNPDQLVEMIGLHLDATFPDSKVWKAFALCLSKLSPWEGDRMSTCVKGTSNNVEQFVNQKVPPIFADGIMERNWKIRCKWWLNRLFSKRMFASEVVAGDLKLMAYKAACASHLYGAKFQYVVKVVSLLEEKEDPLLTFLREQVRQSCGFFVEQSVDSKIRTGPQLPSRFTGSSSLIMKIGRVKNEKRKLEMEAAMSRWNILSKKKTKKR